MFYEGELHKRPAPTTEEDGRSGVHRFDKQLQHRNGDPRTSQGCHTPNDQT